MPKIPGVNHLYAVRALEKAGFRVLRQGKHVVMTDGVRVLTIPRHNPVNAITMGVIVRAAGLTVEELRELLRGEDDTVGAPRQFATSEYLPPMSHSALEPGPFRTRLPHQFRPKGAKPPFLVGNPLRISFHPATAPTQSLHIRAYRKLRTDVDKRTPDHRPDYEIARSGATW